MKKLFLVKVLSVMLMVLMLAGMVPAFADEETNSSQHLIWIDGESVYVDYELTEDGFEYYVYDDEVTIVSYTQNAKEVKIPDKIEGCAVTALNYNAFYNRSLESVTIPASVTCIDSGVFYSCVYLKEIVVDRNNEVYDSRENCNAIIETDTQKLIVGCNNTVIPNSVRIIGTKAFYYAGIKDIVIPAGVTEIEYDAFYHCDNIETIKVDKNNTVYDSRENCNAIIETKSRTLVLGCDNTVIPSLVCAIGDSAFYGCTFENVHIPRGVTSIGDYAFANCHGFTSITIPDNVESIGNNAFSFCDITSVYLNEGLESIGMEAFEYTDITSINIPGSVESIDYGLFNSCDKLTEITVDSANEVYDSRENCNAIIETDTDTLVAGCVNTVIPAGIKEIGQYAFFGVDGLTSIELPGGLKSIGYNAFGFCYDLKSISIPRSMTEIGNSFSYCNALLDVYYEGTQEEWEDIEGLEYIPEAAKIYYEIDLTIPTPEDYDDEDEFDEDDYDDDDTSSRKSKRKNKDDGGNIWVIVGCVGGGVLVLILIAVMLNKKKKTSVPQQVAQQEVPQQPVNVQQPAPQNNDNA